MKNENKYFIIYNINKSQYKKTKKKINQNFNCSLTSLNVKISLCGNGHALSINSRILVPINNASFASFGDCVVIVEEVEGSVEGSVERSVVEMVVDNVGRTNKQRLCPNFVANFSAPSLPVFCVKKKVFNERKKFHIYM